MSARRNHYQDTMNGGDYTYGNGSPNARTHGVLLQHEPSARVPNGQTITLAEWRAQQIERWTDIAEAHALEVFEAEAERDDHLA